MKKKKIVKKEKRYHYRSHYHHVDLIGPQITKKGTEVIVLYFRNDIAIVKLAKSRKEQTIEKEKLIKILKLLPLKKKKNTKKVDFFSGEVKVEK